MILYTVESAIPTSSNVLAGLIDEESRSRSNRHICRKISLLLLKNNGLKLVSKMPNRVLEKTEIKSTYAYGKAYKYKIRLEHGDYAIQISFVKNLWGKVKGWINVYNYKGELVYRAKYVDGELRRSIGSPIYAWIVRLVVEELHIPVKKTRLGDEGGKG